jgi:hypothetical protein
MGHPVIPRLHEVEHVDLVDQPQKLLVRDPAVAIAVRAAHHLVHLGTRHQIIQIVDREAQIPFGDESSAMTIE